jgi:hypothetical protein
MMKMKRHCSSDSSCESQFSQAGMSYVPLKRSRLDLNVVPCPLRKARNMVKKRAVKKIKVSADTRLELSTQHCNSRVLLTNCCS